ncbi:unnamed protein product [Ilex paraguariensis]|uniref:CUE domain-containing protein n=1 Tax=Ilex paraguariensis TaxID=185542 RepID=A0ABC8UE69_9AQUA
MKAGTSTLNPYAASYVPLSKRGAADGNKDYKSGNEAVWLGPHSEGTTKKQQQIAEDPTLKGYPVQGFYGSSSHNPREMTEKHTMDEVFDMDLAYLQMTFPGVSDESLFDVYLANKGDLEATIDMLNQLELYSVDSSGKLPDSLDIGDVSESGSSSNHAAQKLKQVAGEISVSSSGPSDSAIVT